MGYFTKQERESIRNHRYVHDGEPVFEGRILRPFWRFLIRFVPKTIGANSISVAGVIINAVTCFVAWYYSPDGKQTVPSWALWVTALGVFIYNTCDGLDGLQEIRTGGNEVLGEYFDHVCDAYTTVFLSTRLCLAIGIGSTPALGLILGLSSHVAFYVTHWHAHTTGKVVFEPIDNCEGQFLIILACVLAAIFGTDLFTLKDPVFMIEFKHYVVLLTVGGVIVHCIKKLLVLRTNKSTVSGSPPIRDLVPLVLALVLPMVILINSKSGDLEENFCLYVAFCCTVIAKLINNLLVCKPAKKDLTLIDRIFIVPCFLLINQIIGYPCRESYILIAAFVLSSLDHCYYAYDFGCDICEIHDDAPFFKVPKKNSK